MHLRRMPSTVLVVLLTVWPAAARTVRAAPIPSPLIIELLDSSQHGNPGDVLTLSGVLTNTTADTLYIEGWGIGTRGGNESEYPVDFSFTPEWFAWPKAVAFDPFETTSMPLFTAAIAPDFSDSIRILGDFSVAAYPIGAVIRNPDGSLVYENATAAFAIEIGEPPFPEPVPEPSTFLLTALGGLGMSYRYLAHKVKSR